MSIDLSSTSYLNTPVYNMILEHPLVQLMKNIWSEARENVGMRKIGPKR
jgi:hypothetical protein